MSEKLEAYTDINSPPFPPVGKMAQWDGTQWQIVDAILPIPPMPPAKDGFEWHWNEQKREWYTKALPPPWEPTELEKAVQFIAGIAWMFIDGIIDLYPNAAEIKAARAEAINFIKARKGELKQDTPDFA